MEKSILALKLNGEALPEVHGGPVRLVRPGGGGKWHLGMVNQHLADSAAADQNTRRLGRHVTMHSYSGSEKLWEALIILARTDKRSSEPR